MTPSTPKWLDALDAFVPPQAPPPLKAPTQAGTPPPPPPEASKFSNASQAAGGAPPASGPTPQPPPPPPPSQSGPSCNQWAGGQMPPPPNPTAQGSSLPPFDTHNETWLDEIITPTEIVKGLIHAGTKVALVGGSKANKTWSLMDLGFSIAHGHCRRVKSMKKSTAADI